MQIPAAYKSALQRGFEAFVIAFIAVLATSATVFQSALITPQGLNWAAAGAAAGTALLAGTIKAVVQFLEILHDAVTTPQVAATTPTPPPLLPNGINSGTTPYALSQNTPQPGAAPDSPRPPSTYQSAFSPASLPPQSNTPANS